jgi:hypothetical protein
MNATPFGITKNKHRLLIFVERSNAPLMIPNHNWDIDLRITLASLYCVCFQCILSPAEKRKRCNSIELYEPNLPYDMIVKALRDAAIKTVIRIYSNGLKTFCSEDLDELK